MADTEGVAPVDVGPAPPRQRFRHSRRLGWARALMLNIALIGIPLLVYIVVVTQHASAYADERSMRALQEIATQVDNRLDTLRHILMFAPGEASGRIVAGGKSLDPPDTDPISDLTLRQRLREKIRLIPRASGVGLSFSTDCSGSMPCTDAEKDMSAEADAVCSNTSGPASPYRVTISAGHNPELRMFDCTPSAWIGGVKRWSGKTAIDVAITTVPQMIENTQGLAEMPLIVVASTNGQVYVQLLRNHSKDLNPPVHQEVREEVTATNVRQLLVAADKYAAREMGPKDSPSDLGGSDAKPKAACCKEESGPPQGPMTLGLPVALDTRIAGVPYRAYVLPYAPKEPLCTADQPGDPDITSNSGCRASATTLYLIGLRQGGILARATSSLSPGLLLGAMFVLTASFLLWPFLRHALLEPNDAITWWQVRVLNVAFLALSSLGVMAARAGEISYAMYGRMDGAIERVAAQIDDKFIERIRKELVTLEALRKEGSRYTGAQVRSCNGDESAAPERIETHVRGIYPAVESYFYTNDKGILTKGSLSFDEQRNGWTAVCADGDLRKREYFDLLRKGHGVDGIVDGPIILQRLFNRPDGKKVLQLATPNKGPNGEFAGISSVNIGTVGVIVPVLPLGIEYAVFERATGTVVFHSDDGRSLVENFYAETEHNPTLASAVIDPAARGIRFEGRYRGADTTFFYEPMTYSPWGLAVYYQPGSVSAITALSVVNALGVTFAILAASLVLTQLFMWLIRRRHSWLWPQWRLRNAYIAVAAYVATVAICEFLIVRDPRGGVWQTMVLLTAPLYVVSACVAALGARTVDMTTAHPRQLRYRLNRVHWCLATHGALFAAWLVAACIAKEWLACMALVVSFAGLVAVLRTRTETNNRNAWRREVVIWPGNALPATARAGYRLRYLTFAMALAVSITAAPSLAVFDRTFEWYLSSALDLARASSKEQQALRVKVLTEDIRNLEQQGRFDAKKIADEMESFGVASFSGGRLDANGHALFGGPTSVACRNPPVAFPIGAIEHYLPWQNKLLERLRQAALALQAQDLKAKIGADTATCGVNGTLRYLLTTGVSWVAVRFTETILAVVVLTLLVLLLAFSAQHVLGISLPWSGRFGRQKAPVAGCGSACDGTDETLPRHILLLQEDAYSVDSVRKRIGGRFLSIDAATHDIATLDASADPNTSWLIRRIEVAILDEKRRVDLLHLLEARASQPGGSMVLVGGVSPVYRLSRPHAYPGPTWPHVSDNERLRWIDLFTCFEKIYSLDELISAFEPARRRDTVAGPDDGSVPLSSLEEFVYRESRALWPCLKRVRNMLLERIRAGDPLTDRDVIETVALHGEVHYRRAWEYCTREERLALYQLAQGKLINMANHRAIEHLLRRGLVVFEPEPRIKSVSLAEFILNAELPGRMEAWAAEAAEGIWQSLRIPFFVALMLAVAWIAYISGDAFRAAVALIATSVAVIGQALRLLGVAGLPAASKDK